MQKFLLVVFFTLFPLLAHGATYYVAPAPTGDNSRSCATATAPGTPKRDIKEAILCAGPGDTVVAASGVYPEYWGGNTYGGDRLIGIWPSGTTGAPVTVKAAVRGGAIIRPPRSLDNYWFMLSLHNVHDLVIDGFVIDGANQTNAGDFFALNATDSHHITIQYTEIKNCIDNAGGGSGSVCMAFGSEIGAHDNVYAHNVIHDIGTGAVLDQPFYSYAFYMHDNNSIFEYNTIYNISGFGIHAYCGITNECNNNIFRNNRFTNVGVMGKQGAMLVGDGGSNNQIYNNIIDSTGYGIQTGRLGAGPSNNNQFYNNTIVNTKGICIILGPHTSNAVLRNNICFGNNFDGVEVQSGATATMDRNLCGSANTGCTSVGNPLFVNAGGGDFRLQTASPASPAINAGVNVGLPYNGSAPDLGALESGTGISSADTWIWPKNALKGSIQ
jgi:hypothetical protein